MHHFESNHGSLLAPAKIHVAQDKFHMACLAENMSILKFSIHLLADVCKSLEKLIELLLITGLCQACKHLPYDGHILESAAVWIQHQLSLLVW